jgi:hypothetical protein
LILVNEKFYANSEPVGNLNTIHVSQAQFVKEAFDAAEQVMKQCAIAKFRCDRHPTSVNMKRLEVLSVRSIRVVLSSIERVNDVCQTLKENYLKLCDTSSSEIDKSMQVGHAEKDKANNRPSNKDSSNNLRPQSAPPKRNIMQKKSSGKRPQSAFTRRPQLSTKGETPYMHFAKNAQALFAVPDSFDRAHKVTKRKQKKLERKKIFNCEWCHMKCEGEGMIAEIHNYTHLIFNYTGFRIPTSNSLDQGTIQTLREKLFISKMNALSTGEMRDFERRELRTQYLTRKKIDARFGVHNKQFCSWKCARGWNNKNSAPQLRYNLNMLIDMADTPDLDEVSGKV